MLLYLSTEDTFAIKEQLNLASDDDSTFITLTSIFIKDMAGNKIEEIDNGQAMAVTTYTADSTRPNLEQFALDMNTGVLVLTFDETMLGSSFAATQLELQETRTFIQHDDGGYEYVKVTLIVFLARIYPA